METTQHLGIKRVAADAAAMALPGAMPMPPCLHGLELTEAQQDKLFALMHADARTHGESRRGFKRS